ncbi:hypothetical protein D9615_006744 [Tricholomella constricta]|uniref:3-oxo-5-alpha-steroid 4-dehydrogenase C-terminal domain-containing protein n=1 Tax=Tricholomella constricta TaxID=117010 RepID=A0A8H5H700_9AGAR|nr:hypothetical protein D9615_006744 [Tricholomella constricta]
MFDAYYHVARKYFTLVPFAVSPLTFFVDAPFGRFTPEKDSILLVDGIKSWIIMELVSPVVFLATLLTSSSLLASPPQLLLAALYLIHYTNRSVLSPLRTPSRSKSHISVPLSAVFFNTINGALMGTYLSSPAACAFLARAHTRPIFWAGIGLWTLGFAGNIWHDEILLNLRRKARTKGKDKASSASGEHYAIPHGWLYTYVSYPNYLCEWLEWLGFALAAAPLPALLSLSSFTDLVLAIKAPAPTFAPSLTPPYIFLLSEVLLMLPRAVRGHAWYHRRFGPAYPRERRAVIPFLL